MSTYEMLERSINAKKKRGTLSQSYITATKSKMDVFLMADRINQEEYEKLTLLLEG